MSFVKHFDFGSEIWNEYIGIYCVDS